jgi:hypothetical protein
MAISLSSISRTRRLEAPKILLTGLPKVGKSSFAASIPGVVFIPTENGLSGIDAEAFPLAQSLTDVYDAIGSLLNDKHSYKAVAVDSLDWLEGLLHAHVCAANKWNSIEDAGYGKGYVAAAQEWRNLLDGLEALRTQRGMAVVMIAHVKQSRVESPTHEGYDAWQVKLHAKAAALVTEYSDVIGFASHKIIVKKVDAGFGTKEAKAVATQQRMLYLEPHPAYPSGSRFGLHDCELSWDAFAAQLAQLQQPAALAA